MLRILLFGSYARRYGRREVRLSVSRPTELGSLLARLPGLGGRRSSLRVAVNRELAGLNAKVRDGDEVAVMPPFSGG